MASAGWRAFALTWAASIPSTTVCSVRICIRVCRWTGMSSSNGCVSGPMPTVFSRRSTRRILSSFDAGPPAVWQFVANAGDGRTVEIELRAEMLQEKNTTVFNFSRPAAGRAHGKQLPPSADVRLTVRFDIEDRNFHWETKRNGGAEYHFSTNTQRSTNKLVSLSRLRQTASCEPLRAAANIIHSRSGARTFPTRRSKPRTNRQRRRLQPRLV